MRYSFHPEARLEFTDAIYRVTVATLQKVIEKTGLPRRYTPFHEHE